MAALATIAELEARLDFPLYDSITEDDLRPLATAALEDLSEDARHYGKASWTQESVPSVVRSIVLRAAKRYLVNTDGFSQSRSADETVGWEGPARDPQAGSPHFTPNEIAQIEKAAEGKSLPPLGSFGTYAWNSQTFPTPYNRRRVGYVPWEEIL